MALVVYGLTLAPALTWAHWGADGGDFVTAAVLGRVPHPPGFPVYMLLARAFVRVLGGDPAWRLNVLSAVMAAATVGVTVLTLLQRELSLERPLSTWAASAAGLALAFAPLFWSQALITEVYSTAALFVALALWLGGKREEGKGEGTGFSCYASFFIRYSPFIIRHSPFIIRHSSFTIRHSPFFRLLLGVVWGLGIAVHPTVVFLAPLWVGVLWQVGAGSAAAEWRGALYAGLWLCAGVCVGLMPYALLPSWGPWPQPWGDMRTWSGWWDVISARLYWGYALGVPLAEWPRRFLYGAALLTRQFTPVGAALVLWGLWRIGQRSRATLWGGLCTAAVWGLYVLSYRPPDAMVYLVPLLPLFALWLGVGLDDVLIRYLKPSLASGPAPNLQSLNLRSFNLQSSVLLLPAVLLLWNWTALDLHHEEAAMQWLTTTLAAVPPNAVLRSHGDQYSFALWYAQAALDLRPDVLVVERDLWAFDFYRAFIVSKATVGQVAPSAAALPLLENLARGRPWCVLEAAEVVCP